MPYYEKATIEHLGIAEISRERGFLGGEHLRLFFENLIYRYQPFQCFLKSYQLKLKSL